MGVSLHIVFLDSTLDVVDDKFSFVVDCGNITDGDWGCFEGSALDTELFGPLAKEVKLASVELVDVENTLS